MVYYNAMMVYNVPKDYTFRHC